MNQLDKAKKLTADLENKLSINVNFKYFRIVPFIKHTAWHESITKVIQLPDIKGIQFEEFLYHELGHVLISTYRPPNIMFQAFTKRQPGVLQYYLSTQSQPSQRKKGFVSSYAAISTEEDFCECFSAWVVNKFKTTGELYFDGADITTFREPRLKGKLLAVLKILKYCKNLEAKTSSVG